MLPRAQLISIFRVRDGLGLPVGPWFSLGQKLGELRVEHAELVVPRVAHDPELEAAFVLMVPPAGAQRGSEPGSRHERTFTRTAPLHKYTGGQSGAGPHQARPATPNSFDNARGPADLYYQGPQVLVSGDA